MVQPFHLTKNRTMPVFYKYFAPTALKPVTTAVLPQIALLLRVQAMCRRSALLPPASARATKLQKHPVQSMPKTSGVRPTKGHLFPLCVQSLASQFGPRFHELRETAFPFG